MGPYEIAATALKEIIDIEFAAERIVAVHDRLHEALGLEAIKVGIAPVREAPNGRNRVEQHTYLEVRFYDMWQKMVDPTQAVNPIAITDRADRLRAAIRNADITSSGEVWFMHVEDVEYPDDPTGNKTRFHMTVRAWGNNAALVETVAP